MNPPGVVKIHIMLDTKAELRQADILLDFDVFLFQGKATWKRRLITSRYRKHASFIENIRGSSDSRSSNHIPAAWHIDDYKIEDTISIELIFLIKNFLIFHQFDLKAKMIYGDCVELSFPEKKELYIV